MRVGRTSQVGRPGHRFPLKPHFNFPPVAAEFVNGFRRHRGRDQVGVRRRRPAGYRQSQSRHDERERSDRGDPHGPDFRRVTVGIVVADAVVGQIVTNARCG